MIDQTGIPIDATPLPQRVSELSADCAKLREQIARVVVGQSQAIQEILAALFCGGHCLLAGPPGLARTLMVSTLARASGMAFSRIQFTPDMLPTDVTGAEVFADEPGTGRRYLRFLPGPVFANLVLADEINRTPPKTQAALLEAMEERCVTVGNVTHALPAPFLVLATLNIVDAEGVYELPPGSPQLDRFMFRTVTTYPTRAEEDEIIDRTTTAFHSSAERVLSPERLAVHQETIRLLRAPHSVMEYAAELTRLSRPGEADAPGFVREHVAWGAGPRASQFLVMGAKARAAMAGRLHVTDRDVQAVAPAVLRHRVVANFHAAAAGLTGDKLVRMLLEDSDYRRAAGFPIRNALARLLRPSRGT